MISGSLLSKCRHVALWPSAGLPAVANLVARQFEMRFTGYLQFESCPPLGIGNLNSLARLTASF
jgi:hypothetical protein